MLILIVDWLVELNGHSLAQRCGFQKKQSKLSFCYPSMKSTNKIPQHDFGKKDISMDSPLVVVLWIHRPHIARHWYVLNL